MKDYSFNIDFDFRIICEDNIKERSLFWVFGVSNDLREI
jgi:hypothetical protein